MLYSRQDIKERFEDIKRIIRNSKYSRSCGIISVGPPKKRTIQSYRAAKTADAFSKRKRTNRNSSGQESSQKTDNGATLTPLYPGMNQT